MSAYTIRTKRGHQMVSNLQGQGGKKRSCKDKEIAKGNIFFSLATTFDDLSAVTSQPICAFHVSLREVLVRKVNDRRITLELPPPFASGGYKTIPLNRIPAKQTEFRDDALYLQGLDPQASFTSMDGLQEWKQQPLDALSATRLRSLMLMPGTVIEMKFAFFTVDSVQKIALSF
eukprot:gnl/Dysnectes_brevis/1087_a1217_3372.p1 GENE.gnl/Dysnectes_brevis/1087_a1217_3372~~gnl/Dysnectes_brevis/1087_a1217_3372.p1  ORF type:complete len:174 (+),score=12.17 gnl/Dysnectes_brevis/1087_a1217_3372:157-678(+)